MTRVPKGENDIVLPERLNAAAAADLMSTLKGARGRPVCLDASNTLMIGAQCLQVVVAAKKEWLQQGHEFQFTNASTSLIQTLEVLGLDNEIIGKQEMPNGA